jgi:diacylglycerol kinase family enzyme
MLRTKVVGGWIGAAVDVAAHLRHGRVSLHQRSGRDLSFQLDRPVLAEIDGDPVGRTRSGRFGVDPLALVVRVPGPAQRSAQRSAQ